MAVTTQPACAETTALARRLIVTKGKLRNLSHEVCELLPEMQTWAGCGDVFPKLYQIDMGANRLAVARAVEHMEEAHSILCNVHLILKALCKEHDIPIPPDPKPEGGGGR